MAGEDDGGAPSGIAEAQPSAPAADTPSPAPAPSPSTQSPPATPAAEPGTQSKESLLDAVLKVVPATNETDVLADKDKKPPPEGEKTDIEAKAEAEGEDGADDDEPAPQDAPPILRKKINKLLKQRRELRDEVVALRPAAEIGIELEAFAKVNDLDGEAIAGTLKLASMWKHGDIKGFYEAIAPIVRQAQEYLGIVLPKDLADLVKNQQMTEPIAKTLARQRYDSQRTQTELQTTREAHGQAQVTYAKDSVKRAVSNFELKLQASDPDYKVIAPSVKRAAQAMLFERGGRISSVQEALDITKAAYDEVKKATKAFAPMPRATAPLPNGSAQSPSARAAPKTMMEAALMGLEMSRRGG